MRIRYLDGERLRQSLTAAADAVIVHRQLLDAINVFPVPDGDTGSNMACTLEAAVAGIRDAALTLPQLADRVAEDAVLGARGNSGLILCHFFLGLREAIGDRLRMESADLAASLTAAVRDLYDAIEKPGERRLLPRLLQILGDELPPGSRIRAGAAHADCADRLDEPERELRRRYDVACFHRVPLTPVLGAHAGPGGWGICVLPDPSQVGAANRPATPGA